MVDSIDLVEHAVVVVLGFGAGWHVKRLAERMSRAGVIVVFESDLALLRAVFEHVDHSRWMREALIVWVIDPDDRGVLARKLQGAESIIAQGVEFLEHAPSRAQRSFAESSARFANLFRDHVAAAKTTLVTTLIRSVDTIRNLLHNIDQYVGGEGVAELANAVPGFPAIVVSAGPSLRRNVDLLARPGVRDRCVIIAVQTVLKPLLARGIQPHFVTALDYHEISRRFYEGLNADDVRGITLVADPKVHPVVIDSFPGSVRCCASPFLDEVLGVQHRDMGALPAGATVAHLAVYLAHHLGCNPIALIGQDLAFTDGLYYSPGTAIHDTWAPELNTFNTIEMMEWQRIARHRRHLQKVRDIHGRTIYSDAQMTTYLQQFERDFAEYRATGVRIIDATEGGAAKQHAELMPLRDVLDRFATQPVPSIPAPAQFLDTKLMESSRARVRLVREEAHAIRRISTETAALIRRMLDEQHDASRMRRHFETIEANRGQIEKRMATFELLNHLNQLGVFKRLNADRRLHMQRDVPELERQRLQLRRDLENVTWIADAADEMVEQLTAADRLLAGHVEVEPKTVAHAERNANVSVRAGQVHASAMIAIDPERNGLGIARSLAAPFAGRTVLQATLERLGHSRQLESIVLIAPDGFNVESLINRKNIGMPVQVERCVGSPLPKHREAIAAARLWSDTSWRGGLGGMTIYDEVLAPQVMSRIMEQRGITVALVCGPDWPLIDVTPESGCDALIARHRLHADEHKLVFSQVPPGLCGCLISAPLMQELARGTRLSTVGALLSYQPHLPQGDPIARDCCVQIPAELRHAQVRATFDHARWRNLVQSSCESIWTDLAPAREFAIALERAQAARPFAQPQHVLIELTTRRSSFGAFAESMRRRARPLTMSVQSATAALQEISGIEECVLSFSGRGDPLECEQFAEVARVARTLGIRIHVRTELRCDRSTIDELVDIGVDVISVDLQADRAATYRTMMGDDQFRHVLLNLEHLREQQRKLSDLPGHAGFELPWLVPRIERRPETLDDIDSFFDRWLHLLGSAIIDGSPVVQSGGPEEPWSAASSLLQTATPRQAADRERRRCMTILADGSVPIDAAGPHSSHSVGNIADHSIAELWSRLVAARPERSTAGGGAILERGAQSS